MSVKINLFVFSVLDSVELQFEGNETTHRLIGLLHVCDLNEGDALDVIFTNSAPDDVTVNVSASSQGLDVNQLTQSHDALLECFQTNTRSYDIILEMELSYHGNDVVQFIGVDNTLLYSQPIVVETYTLVSPCGTYGHCTSEHDPECTSNQR